MADDPQARYATAEQLAADVKRWLADEPVAVYREPLGQRLARWLRRHRTLAGVAAVVVLVVVPLTIGFSLLVAAKNQELSQTNRDLESALAREEEQRQLADQRRQQAERAADRARSVIELVASDEAFDQLSRKKQLTAEEKKLLEALVPYYEEYARESGSGQAEQERQARAYFRWVVFCTFWAGTNRRKKPIARPCNCMSDWWPSIPRCPSTARNWP
jgi:hypothetical protein